ncbi:DeoR/GlpR family DNA-binding transcription regulator [Moorellaceae bacterium AZ2]
MFREERLQAIYEKIRAEKKALVKDLAKEFGISASSIRLDLAELESRGLITRTYGGATLPNHWKNGSSLTENISELDVRNNINQAEKDAIGRLAASLVNDGDTIMIDGGSTTRHVAEHLSSARKLTVITNSISLLPALYAIKDVTIYLIGGLLYRENAVLIGDLANDMVKAFHPDKVIMGIDGISLTHGLTAANPSVPAVASFKRKLVATGSQLIIVADHTKLGRVCPMPIAPLSRMNYLVTDDQAPADFLEGVRLTGCTVLVAEVSR